jgi:hypothetical protein
MNGNDILEELTADEDVANTLHMVEGDLNDAETFLDDEDYENSLGMIDEAMAKLTSARVYLQKKVNE